MVTLQVPTPPSADRSQLAVDQYGEASVLFADIAEITERASDMMPRELVSFLNDAHSRFDRLAEQLGLEKIRTTGDA